MVRGFTWGGTLVKKLLILFSSLQRNFYTSWIVNFVL